MKIAKYISLSLSIILTAGVMTVFQACPIKEDGTWMHCHDAQMLVFFLGLALIVLNLISLFVHKKTALSILGVAGILLCIGAFLIPGTFNPMCMMSTMRCHAIMKPFVRVVSAGNILAFTGMIYVNQKG
ncbi:MAG: DUF4418 family protein [Faecalicoccus sp.]|nr:DUF4418 family protein [Faecalicoccus sp.]